MLWILGDLIRAMREVIKMLRDREFWKELKENLRELNVT